MSLLTINYELLLLYSVYYAGDGLDFSSVYWTSLVCLSVQGNKHFSREQAVRFVTSDPAHCQGGGGAYLSAVAQLIPPPVPNIQPRGWQPGCLDVFSAISVTPSTELKLCGRWDGGTEWTSAQTCTDSPACRELQQFPANLFVLYCTHQVPVSHHPFPL